MSLLLRSLVLCVCLFAGLAQTGCQSRSARSTKPPTSPMSIPTGKPPVEIPVAKPLVPTPPIPDSRGSWYEPRSKWTQQSIVVSRTKPMGGTPNVITVHHSGDKDDIHTESGEWLRQVDLNHIKGTGHAEPWACIGYHFIIDVSGKVYEGRPLKYQGAHAGNDQVNKLNIGICLIGDFDQARVPAGQRTALLSTLDRLCLQYDINRTSVYGHQHFKSTECPGRYLSQIIASYTQRPAEAAEPTRKQALVPRAASRLGTVTPAHK